METCFQTNFITSTDVQLAALGVTNNRLPTASAQPSTLEINTAARQDNQTFVPLSFQSCFAFSTTACAVAVIFPIRSQNTEVTQSSLYLWDLPATDPLLVPAYSPVNSSPKKKSRQSEEEEGDCEKCLCDPCKWAQPLQSCPGYRIIVTRSGKCCM